MSAIKKSIMTVKEQGKKTVSPKQSKCKRNRKKKLL